MLLLFIKITNSIAVMNDIVGKESFKGVERLGEASSSGTWSTGEKASRGYS